MIKKITKFYLIAVIAVFCLASVAGGVVLADDVYNYFYGPTEIIQNAGETPVGMGSVAAVGGICDGSEPTTQLCNVNVYDISSQTGLTVDAGDTNVDSFVQGGAVLNASSSLTDAITLTAAQVCDSNVIHVNSDATSTTNGMDASIDITLPATTTLFADCLTTNGDDITFMFENRAVTAASTTQIVAGGGMDLVEPDGQNVEIGGGNYALIKIVRTDKSTTIQAMTSVDEHIAAD